MSLQPFTIEPYVVANDLWPSTGKHILGTFTEDTVVVYQAYNQGIGTWVAEHQTFVGCPGYSMERMTWIKSNFLWIMYRSGWGTKTNQESILAITLKLDGFIQLLKLSKRHDSDQGFGDYKGFEECNADVCPNNDVRIQWDPDHDPFGEKVERRAIQLGIRGKTLQTLLRKWIVSVSDITEFVRSQCVHVQNCQLEKLQVPTQRIYEISDKSLRCHLGMEVE